MTSVTRQERAAPDQSSAAVVGAVWWRLVLGAAIVFAASCAVFWGTTRVIKLPPAWRTFEFCQYAEIGRNLAVDGTFDTRLVEPMALALLDRDRVGRPAGRWPVVNRYPLPSLAVAGWMLAAGPTDTAAAWSNGLAISLLAALAYAAARQWYGPRWALVVALLFLANPSFYGEFVLLGTPDVWFATVFVAQLLLWSRLDPAGAPRPAVGWAFGVGLLSGLSYLARFNASLFVALQTGVLLGYRRWREALVIVAAAAALSVPLMVDNWAHFHRPFVSLYSAWNLLDGIGAYPAEPWLYYQVPNLGAELVAHAGGLGRKLARNLLTIVPVRVWTLWRLELLLPLALMAPALPGWSGSTRRFSRWSVGLFAWQLVVFSALRLELEERNSPHHGRYFFWFATPALLLGAGVLSRLSAHSRVGRGVAAVVVLAQISFFGWSWGSMVSRHAQGTNLGHDPVRMLIRQVVTDDQVIASNQPQITAWFSGRRSISLPANPEELARLNRQSPTPADYLFIDTNFNCIQLDLGWYGLAQNDPRQASPWEPRLLRAYEYALPPDRTRPLGYVLLRRRAVAPSPLELQLKSGASPG